MRSPSDPTKHCPESGDHESTGSLGTDCRRAGGTHWESGNGSDVATPGDPTDSVSLAHARSPVVSGVSEAVYASHDVENWDTYHSSYADCSPSNEIDESSWGGHDDDIGDTKGSEDREGNTVCLWRYADKYHTDTVLRDT